MRLLVAQWYISYTVVGPEANKGCVEPPVNMYGQHIPELRGLDAASVDQFCGGVYLKQAQNRKEPSRPKINSFCHEWKK